MTSKTVATCFLAMVLAVASPSAFGQFKGLRLGPLRVGGSSGGGIKVGITPGNGWRTQPPVRTYPVQPPRTVQPIINPAVPPRKSPPRCTNPGLPPGSIVRPVNPPHRVVSPPPSAVTPLPVPKVDPQVVKLRELADQAKTALRKQKYDDALSLANEMVELVPGDGGVLQFRAAVHFGRTDYANAAIDSYNAILSGPIWTKANVKDVYGDPAPYHRDVKWLQSATEEKPDVLAHQFLSAYHAIIAEDFAASQQHLERMLAIQPNEPVATKLLQVVVAKQQSEDSPESVARSN